MHGKSSGWTPSSLTLGLAAWALALGVCIPGPGLADEPLPSATNQISLELVIAGLGPQGCEVEIKPAHAACEFKVIKQKVSKDGKLNVPPFLAKSASADLDCTFAIVIREPGKPPRTIRRGIRLDTQVAGAEVPKRRLPCYVTAQIARTDAPATRTR